MTNFREYSGIVWKNVYHMLCYSVKYLAELNLTESDFENTVGTMDLFSRLLIKAHEYSLSHSSLADYTDFRYTGLLPTGAIDPYKSIITGAIGKGKLCYTERKLNVNTLYNRIIKCAYELLINTNRDNGELGKDKSDKLWLMYNEFHGVTELNETELEDVYSGRVEYSSLPYWHRPVITASVTIINNFLYTDEEGSRLILGFDNYDRLNHIFEEFVRNYLADAFIKTGYGVISKPIYRVYGGGTLRLDILAQHKNRYLVIDTKWYDRSQSDKDNENQVYRYVGETLAKHPEFDSESAISGMLLFAKVKSDKTKMNDTKPLMFSLIVPIYYNTIDLDDDFEKIKATLYNIVVDRIENMQPNIRK